MTSQIVFLVGILAIGFFSCSGRHSTFYKNKVIAHRGAWKAQKHPQNSLASLQEAIDLKCEGSEFDVWMTADGVLVANHDADHAGMMIEQVTYKQLLTEPLPNGENIPTAEAYLKKGMSQDKTKLIFEIKPSGINKKRGLEIAEKSVELVRSLKAEQWVDYITFDYDIGLKVIELDSSANVAYLTGDRSPEILKKEGFFGFDYNIKTVRENPQWINEAQDLGLTVNVWTVNKKEDMEWLLSQDVDFITTDEPELLFQLINP
ncbi:MAG: glycerophosphodiester phosphodiesterase family protein [Cyclobacteriaceae bacterium]